MTPFDELRADVKKQRDTAIKTARDAYEQAMKDIASLERRIGPPPTKRPRRNKPRSLINLAVDCLPHDRTFDIDELRASVMAADASRKPSQATMRSCVHRLVRQGVLKRVQNSRGRQKAQFAVASLEIDREPTLREWVERVTSDADGPPEPDEVRMLDAGYQPDCEPREVLGSVRRVIDSIPS